MVPLFLTLVFTSVPTSQYADVLVMLWTWNRLVFSSNTGRETVYLDKIRGFPQSIQPNAGIVLRLRHGRFLSNTFQIICHTV
jgi:hypothetical protein